MSISLGADYDAFIMNFLRVNPKEDSVAVQITLDVPADLAFFSERLKKGDTLEFSIEARLKQGRIIMHDKQVGAYQKSYYIQYDPLTKQYLILDNAKPILINVNATYLLRTFVQNLQFEIGVELIKDKQYELIIDVQLYQSTDKPWKEKNLFFVSKEIIQPATFNYNFDY